MELDQKTEITLAAEIMAGLLSTGMYTQPNPKGDPIKYMIRRGNAGENWEAEGRRCAEPAHVVDDALALLWELNVALTAGVTPAVKEVVDALRPKKAEPKVVMAPTPQKKKAVAKKRKK